MKTINIITNINNGAGLQKDAELFSGLLDRLGHKWRTIAYDRPHDGISYPADISLFMEVMPPNMLHHAPENWLMPNSEWWNRSYEFSLPFIKKVLCKTHDCMRIWEQKCPGKCVYTGFESVDYNTNVPPQEKELNFYHLAGNSQTKNTEAVCDAWREFKIPYHLEVVIRDTSYIPRCHGVRNVTYYQRVPESQVQMGLNIRAFHLMPSHYEGFGHVIHEALGCGGIVLTTDAPPMNEFPGVPKELLISSSTTWMKELATCHKVQPADVYRKVMEAGAMSLEKRTELSIQARKGFLSEREAYRERMKALLA